MRAVGFWKEPWMWFLVMGERRCRVRRDSRRWRRGGGDFSWVLGQLDEQMRVFPKSRCPVGADVEQLRNGRWGCWERAGERRCQDTLTG